MFPFCRMFIIDHHFLELRHDQNAKFNDAFFVSTQLHRSFYRTQVEFQALSLFMFCQLPMFSNLSTVTTLILMKERTSKTSKYSFFVFDDSFLHFWKTFPWQFFYNCFNDFFVNLFWQFYLMIFLWYVNVWQYFWLWV